MINAATQSLLFLINTLFSLYIFVLTLRLLCQLARVDFYNPLLQILFKLTNPVLIWFEHWLPSFKTFNIACFLIILAFESLKLTLTHAISPLAANINAFQILQIALANSLTLIIDCYFYSIMIVIVFTWLAMMQILNLAPVRSVVALLSQMVDIILSPFQRLIPPLGGLDISPVFALIALQIFQFFVHALY